MPHTKPCVLRIPLIAVMMLLALWVAIGYSSLYAHAAENRQRSIEQNTTLALATDGIQLHSAQLAQQPTRNLPVTVTLQPAPPAMIESYFPLASQMHPAGSGASILVTKTVGLGPECAPNNELIITNTMEVVYCYIVLNVGNSAIITHTVIDDQEGILLLDEVYPRDPGGGENSGAFFTIPVTVSQTITNIVDWQALDEQGATAAATAAARVVIPTLALTTTLGTKTGQCGQERALATLPDTTITICYTVKNTSPVALSGHTLIDSNIGEILVQDPTPLAPGAVRSVLRTMLVTETTTSVISWAASTANQIPAVAMDQIDIQVPSIELRTTVGVATTACPESKMITVTIDTMVTLCYLVTNTGGYTFDKHTISDTLYQYPSLDMTLLPGESRGITVTFAATETVHGTGEWRASGPGGLLVIDRDNFTVEIRNDATVDVFVFYDVSGNGLQNDLEPGLSDVSVTLISPNQRFYTVTTDSNGLARLEGLPESGNYTAVMDMSTLPVGYKETTTTRQVAVERGRVVTKQLGVRGPEGMDSDADGIPDIVEGPGDYDGDGDANYLDLDSDNDGILDSIEGYSDTDNDGRPNRLDGQLYIFLPLIRRE